MQQADRCKCGKRTYDDGQTYEPKIVLVGNAIEHCQHVCLNAYQRLLKRLSGSSARPVRVFLLLPVRKKRGSAIPVLAGSTTGGPITNMLLELPPTHLQHDAGCSRAQRDSCELCPAPPDQRVGPQLDTTKLAATIARNKHG